MVTLTVTLDTDESVTKEFKFPMSVLEQAGNDIQPATPPPGSDALPPLRNPPLLESSEDLASLSNLNEPSGACLYFWSRTALTNSSPRDLNEIRLTSAVHLLRYRLGELAAMRMHTVR
jgi:hypothetical protein